MLLVLLAAAVNPPGLAGVGRTNGGGLDDMRDLDGVAGAPLLEPSPFPSSTESGSDIACVFSRVPYCAARLCWRMKRVTVTNSLIITCATIAIAIKHEIKKILVF